MKKFIHTRSASLLSTCIIGIAVTLVLLALPRMSFAQTPIEISTCNELQLMGSDPVTYPMDGDYVLTGDIDCTDSASWNEGDGFEPIGNDANRFTGTFNGNGFEISDLTINRPATTHVGLFGYAENGTEFSDVGLVDVSILGRGRTGGIIGTLGSSTSGDVSQVNRVYVRGDVTGTSTGVGGIIGYANNVTMTNTYMRGAVVGESDTGGLAGFASNLDLSNSYGAATVISNCCTARALIGGQVNGSIQNSFWDIDLNGITEASQITGDIGSKTTIEMKTESTFTDVGWDFDTVWSIAASRNDGYPYIGDPLDPIIIEEQLALNITRDAAVLSARITSGEVKGYGFFWGTESHDNEAVEFGDVIDIFPLLGELYPQTDGAIDIENVELPHEFLFEIEGLQCATTYYVRTALFDYIDVTIVDYLIGEEFSFSTLACPSTRRSSGGRVSRAFLAEAGIILEGDNGQADPAPQSETEIRDDRNDQIISLITTLEKDSNGNITQAGFIQFIMGLIEILR